MIEGVVEALPELFFGQNHQNYLNIDLKFEDNQIKENVYKFIKQEIFDAVECYYENKYAWLYFSIKLIKSVLKLLEYNKLEYLIKMEEYVTDNLLFVSDTPLLGILMSCDKTENINFNEQVFKHEVNDDYLEFFFSKSFVCDALTPEEIVILLLTYFYKKQNDNVLEEINNNWNSIVNILKSDDNKFVKEKKIKRISKILND